MTTVVAVAYFVIWAVISWLSSPSLDSYGDMVENYAWSQTLALGTFKHPPLFAWIVGAWFALFPTRVWAYYLLSYVNAAIGIAGIVCLGRLWVPEAMSAARRRAFLTAVAVFAALSFPYSNLAAKFNADTVLLSLWPWTAYACCGPACGVAVAAFGIRCAVRRHGGRGDDGQVFFSPAAGNAACRNGVAR